MRWICWYCVLILASAHAHAQCEVQQLFGDGPGAFGRAVSIDGDVIVVGDWGDSVGLGAAFVFRLVDGAWTQEAKLTSPVPDADDRFARSVAVSGDVVFVGAADQWAPESDRGAVHVYRFDGATWEYEQELIGFKTAAGSRFGWSVSIDADVAVIGAWGHDIDGMIQAGAASVFRNRGDEWVEEAIFTAPAPQAFDYFGWSVSVSGSTVFVCAHGRDHSCNVSGSAFSYRYDGQDWALEDELYTPDECGWFGFAVAVSGSVAIVGATEEDGQNGAAYIYRDMGTNWAQEARIAAAEPVGVSPYFGEAVAVSDSAEVVLVGAPSDAGIGAAHVFQHRNSRWYEKAKLTRPGSVQFGQSVSIGHDIAVVGAQPAPSFVFAGASEDDCNSNGEPDACEVFEGTSPDRNDNGIPDECDCLGDISGDLLVGFDDLLALLSSWGPCPACPEDLDGDGTVGFDELLVVLSQWGPCTTG